MTSRRPRPTPRPTGLAAARIRAAAGFRRVAARLPGASARAKRADARVLAALEYAGWVPFACGLIVLILTSLAGVAWVTSPYYGNSPAAPQAHARNVGTIPTRVAPSTVADIVSPNRIEIPKIHANAPIVQVGTTTDGEMEIPLDPHKVGWWHYGAKPGAKVGTAILAGHINYAGVTGSMAAIGKLNPGDLVYVFGRQNADNKHEVAFRVTGVRTYHKTHLPYKEIFDQKSVGRIAIVTCGGPFDASTGNYLDNIVVFAVPATNAAAPPSVPGIPGVRSPSPSPSN